MGEKRKREYMDDIPKSKKMKLNNNNNVFGFSSDDDDDLLMDDPYLKLANQMKNNNNNNNNDNNELKFNIHVESTSLFFNNDNRSQSKSSTSSNKKKRINKYSKNQREIGYNAHKAHLSLLVYRYRFRTLLCTDMELRAKMMSILPILLHPNEYDNGYANINLNYLTKIISWFNTYFRYKANIEFLSRNFNGNKTLLNDSLKELHSIIDSRFKVCGLTHMNILFFTLLCSFKIPTKYAYVLKPINHNPSKNQIFDKIFDINELKNMSISPKKQKKKKTKKKSRAIGFINKHKLKLQNNKNNSNNNGSRGSTDKFEECIEVYVADIEQWIHVILNKGRIHMDFCKSNAYLCDCETKFNKLNYVVSIDPFGMIKDVTPRYAKKWSTVKKNRNMFEDFYNNTLIKAWNETNLEYANMYQFISSVSNTKWQTLLELDDKQLLLKIESESIPKSISCFNNHPLYAIEKYLKKYEYIYPNDELAVIATVKGCNVYSRNNVKVLYSKERLYQMGYKLKNNENHLKTTLKSKMKNEYLELYGTWQCNKLQRPHVTINENNEIIIPKNDKGNIDLTYTDIHIPFDCVHIKKKDRLVYTAKKMNIDFAKALVGFEFSSNSKSMVPQFDGIIIHKKYKDKLLQLCNEYNVYYENKKLKKHEKEMNKLWKFLVHGIMVYKQLSINKQKHN